MPNSHTTPNKPLDLAPALMRSAETAATRKGMTTADYTRDALIRQLDEDDLSDQPNGKFGPETARFIRESARQAFGGKKLPGDSTDFIRAARDGRVDQLP